jgi:probable rRNA maturation factor
MVTVEVQYAETGMDAPSEESFQQWSAIIPVECASSKEVSIRVVNEDEIAELNSRFRQKQGATNVLAFPAEIPAGVELNFIGDIVICAPIVIKQAQEQGKSMESHWAHMTLHGILHLLGYDHIDSQDAEVMEALEVQLLTDLGYANPYT